jgi:H+/gluconate symporter-like permease
MTTKSITLPSQKTTIITIYSHSSHKVVLAPNTEQTSDIGSIGNTLGNPLVLGLIIAVLIVVIAALAIIIFRKGKVKTSANN